MAMRYYAPSPGTGGESSRSRGPHALRIGDAEREAAATDLGEHYAAGRLTLDELNERLDAVFSAKTFGQLGKIMADLPGPRWTWRAEPRAAGAPMAGFPPRGRQAPPTQSDRAGRFAALSLLLLAMLIWLFTALIFARHGIYHQVGPAYPQGPMHHLFQQTGQFGP